ncbi:glycosyltransferase [Nocardioides sp. Y6]|uniref:Glycosyltransferase n=2 Tax=Nocardioides malaquae TaxID=2773426 RepID=A0ABR9RX27_9ACTN|nr:glycosyltransferase [Nocardioides malaquae]
MGSRISRVADVRADSSPAGAGVPPSSMREVRVETVPLQRLAQFLEPDRVTVLESTAAAARTALEGRVVWNVNATASGGGVAEMLTTLLAYSRGAGVDARWLVLDGNPRFFRITKRIHNLLHGSPGDGGPLGQAERDEYEAVLASNLETLNAWVKPGDIVLLHDPQTAALAAGLRTSGAHVVWRCHVGRDVTNQSTDLAWDFLRPYVSDADASIFSRPAYVPEWLEGHRTRIIPPSLDPFSTKNIPLAPADVTATLRRAGLVDLPAGLGSLTFSRRDGSLGSVRSHGNLLVAGEVVPADARVVLQVSRWDRLKDMAGVLTSFATHLATLPDDAHLVLVGPDVLGVSDDPEGAEVLFECVDLWKALAPEVRARVHLVSLPMDDEGENAHLVNALQSYASVVVQKSLVEGFGLTVTEPMWKGRPVVASAVGGIQDQVVDGESGLLLRDPTDLAGFADLIASLLNDDDLARRLGGGAQERVRAEYLGDRHLIQYAELFAELLRG